MTENGDSIINAHLIGKPNSENSSNKTVLNSLIQFILSTERFNNPSFYRQLKTIRLISFFHFLPGVFGIYILHTV